MTHHYTYRITTSEPTDDRRFYIGVRSSDCHPAEDSYWGSCSAFNKWQKKHGRDSLTKEILAIWGSRELAMEHEIKLHAHFDVAYNDEFFNQTNAVSAEMFQDVEITRQVVTNLWKDAEYRQRMSDAHKGQPAWNKGKRTPDDVRAKQSAKAKGRPCPMKGKKHTPESIKRMKDAHKGQDSPMVGKKHSAESRAKMSAAQKGKKLTDEHKANISKNNARWHLGKTFSKEHRRKLGEAHIEQTPWNKGGGVYSEETRKKMGDARRGKSYQEIFGGKAEEVIEKQRARMTGENNPNYGKTLTEDQRQKISASKKGKVWYNNGEMARMFYKNTQPENFTRGRGKRSWQS